MGHAGLMRFATWNVNSVKARLPRLLEWLDATKPDVLCLQETKVPADGFPSDEVGELGYADRGVRTGALERGRAAVPDRAGRRTPRVRRRARLSRTRGAGDQRDCAAGIRFMSVYVPNGRTPEDPHYTYKLAWLAALRDALVGRPGGRSAGGGRRLQRGPDRRRRLGSARVFVGATHVTPPERAALAAIREFGLRDIVGRPLKGDRPFTYWDYRAGMFHQNKGMRIDLVYATPDIAAKVTDAVVDREARKGKGPSDHAPIVVDVDA